jgi:hypothetical protein
MWPSLGKEFLISVQLEVDGKDLIKLCGVADEFPKLFQSVYNNPCPAVFPPFRHLLIFSLAPVSDSDYFKAIKRLRPSKYVGFDDIPDFITKG